VVGEPGEGVVPHACGVMWAMRLIAGEKTSSGTMQPPRAPRPIPSSSETPITCCSVRNRVPKKIPPPAPTRANRITDGQIQRRDRTIAAGRPSASRLFPLTHMLLERVEPPRLMLELECSFMPPRVCGNDRAAAAAIDCLDDRVQISRLLLVLRSKGSGPAVIVRRAERCGRGSLTGRLAVPAIDPGP